MTISPRCRASATPAASPINQQNAPAPAQSSPGHQATGVSCRSSGKRCCTSQKRMKGMSRQWPKVEAFHHMSAIPMRSEEHTSDLQSLMRISYAVFCLKKKTTHHNTKNRDE